MSGNVSEKGQSGAVRESGKDLDVMLRELEDFLNGEFHRRVMGFWYVALKYYVENVLDVFGLEKEFGELQELWWGTRFSIWSCDTSITSTAL